jgi:XTP/dITP diphosphohydrolase
MSRQIELLFATGNPNKVDEIQAQVPEWIQLSCLADLRYSEDLPETGNTLKENAIQKAAYAYNLFGGNVFAEDTGLEVHSLNNEPGVFSARYAGPQRNSTDNMNLLLEKLENSKGTVRDASFRTVIALIWNNQWHIFEGEVNGIITRDPRGNLGFGYDPVFQPGEGDGRTFAEMTIQEKKEISHRGRAMAKLIRFLQTLRP